MAFDTEKYARYLIIFKWTLQRGYAWCQLPTLALIGAGILLPYIKQYGLDIRFWQLSLIALVGFFAVGWVDRKLKLLHAENSYGVETNPLLLKGLKGELK